MADDKTIQLVRDWESSIERLNAVNNEINYAKCCLANNTNELGRWLVPEDAKVGEVFSIWIAGKMLSVEKIADSGLGDFKVSWRQEKVRTVKKGDTI